MSQNGDKTQKHGKLRTSWDMGVLMRRRVCKLLDQSGVDDIRMFIARVFDKSWCSRKWQEWQVSFRTRGTVGS